MFDPDDVKNLAVSKPEMQPYFPQLHHVAVFQDLTMNALPIDPGSIGGIQIANLECAIRQVVNLGVVSRNRIVVEAEIVI